MADRAAKGSSVAVSITTSPLDYLDGERPRLLRSVRFYLVDRQKDMIVASGYKVWPREVEDVLLEHPAVREAAVVGVPDDYRGETVKAFVSPRPGRQRTPTELISYCRENMAAYKYPRQVEIREELPKTPTGKLLRRELRDS